MKRNFLWTAPALAAALWMGGSGVRAAAQSVEGAADTATEAAADTSATAGSASTTTDAAGSADSATSSTDAASSTDTSADTSATATTTDAAGSATNDSTISTDAATTTDSQTTGSASGQLDAQSSTQLEATAQPSAGASTDATTDAAASAQAPATQPGASADLNADANLSTDAAVDARQAQSQIPGAAATDIDASIQGDAGLQARQQAGARQNLQAGLDFGQATERGLVVNTIAHDHFFYDSGLRRGDVLVSYGGHPIRSQADFNRWVAYQPGERVPVVVLRNGRPQTIYIVYEQQRAIEHQAGYAPSGAYLGVTFDAQNPQQAVIRSVAPGSPAEQVGLSPGDVIVAINGNRVGGYPDVTRMVQSMQPGQAISVAVAREVVLGARQGVAQAAYAPNVRIQGSVTQAVPATPAVPGSAVAGSTTVEGGAYVGSPDAIDSNFAPGSGRYDNTPARAGDTDRDGRLLDADGRVGPAEGDAILPRRRN